MLNFIQQWFSSSRQDVGEWLAQGALIVDVRSPQEFATGHAKGAVNIPLPQLEGHLPDLQQQAKKIVTCCKSGVRSARAASYLRQAGLEACNGGSWQKVQAKL